MKRRTLELLERMADLLADRVIQPLRALTGTQHQENPMGARSRRELQEAELPTTPLRPNESEPIVEAPAPDDSHLHPLVAKLRDELSRVGTRLTCAEEDAQRREIRLSNAEQLMGSRKVQESMEGRLVTVEATAQNYLETRSEAADVGAKVHDLDSYQAQHANTLAELQSAVAALKATAEMLHSRQTAHEHTIGDLHRWGLAGDGEDYEVTDLPTPTALDLTSRQSGNPGTPPLLQPQDPAS